MNKIHEQSRILFEEVDNYDVELMESFLDRAELFEQSFSHLSIKQQTGGVNLILPPVLDCDLRDLRRKSQSHTPNGRTPLNQQQQKNYCFKTQLCESHMPFAPVDRNASALLLYLLLRPEYDNGVKILLPSMLISKQTVAQWIFSIFSTIQQCSRVNARTVNNDCSVLMHIDLFYKKQTVERGESSEKDRRTFRRKIVICDVDSELQTEGRCCEILACSDVMVVLNQNHGSQQVTQAFECLAELIYSFNSVMEDCASTDESSTARVLERSRDREKKPDTTGSNKLYTQRTAGPRLYMASNVNVITQCSTLNSKCCAHSCHTSAQYNLGGMAFLELWTRIGRLNLIDMRDTEFIEDSERRRAVDAIYCWSAIGENGSLTPRFRASESHDILSTDDTPTSNNFWSMNQIDDSLHEGVEQMLFDVNNTRDATTDSEVYLAKFEHTTDTTSTASNTGSGNSTSSFDSNSSRHYNSLSSEMVSSQNRKINTSAFQVGGSCTTTSTSLSTSSSTATSSTSTSGNSSGSTSSVVRLRTQKAKTMSEDSSEDDSNGNATFASRSHRRAMVNRFKIDTNTNNDASRVVSTSYCTTSTHRQTLSNQAASTNNSRNDRPTRTECTNNKQTRDARACRMKLVVHNEPVTPAGYMNRSERIPKHHGATNKTQLPQPSDKRSQLTKSQTWPQIAKELSKLPR